MSYKTQRLVDLFPDAYAADEQESLLYKLLDALGAELMAADDALKRLLKSHWVDYAEGAGLDGLASIFGVERRRLRDGTLETDGAFRQRVKALVPLFTGGGTKQAVIGAVRSALGLPFDLGQLVLPAQFEGLRRDLEHLIYVEEFSPKGERIVSATGAVADPSELILVVDLPSVQQQRPTIDWNFTSGNGRSLTLELLDGVGGSTGIKSLDDFSLPQDSILTLSAKDDGRLTAVVGFDDVSHQFANLDSSTPAVLPEVPLGRSEWRFRARSGIFDFSRFGSAETFDVPGFEAEMSWLRYEPLTFDVHIPYFLQEAVDRLKALHGYTGQLFVFEGLPFEAVVDVVDQTRAAGVRGRVQFSLSFSERNDPYESLEILGTHVNAEDAAAAETFTMGSFNEMSEDHAAAANLVIGGVFDNARFDENFGFRD